MKKSSFVALILGTIGGFMFALGMCMALLPEWNAFTEGVIFSAAGLVIGLATLFIWCRMEGKKLPAINAKNALRALYIIAALLILGFRMCMCLVWQNFIWGTLVGIVGIIMLICLIPMIKGLE